MGKTCIVPGCSSLVFGKGYCRRHQFLRTDVSQPKRNTARIKQYSVKRTRINKVEYGPKARQYIIDNPYCNIRSPECTGIAQCVNHRKGKDSIALLLDSQFWEPSCFMCNLYIEKYHKWGSERGHKLSRHTKY